MVRVRIVPKEEAQVTRKVKEPGVRRQRMDQFDGYTQVLLDNPEQAAIYEEIEENPQKFVLSLRGAFKRAGLNVSVRKMRAKDEVRAWVTEESAEAPAASRQGRARKAG